MRWYQDLTLKQQRILLALALGVVLAFGLVGWLIWSTVNGAATVSSPPTSVLPSPIPSTSTPTPTLTATPPPPTLTPTPGFIVADAGVIAGRVAEARGTLPRWNTPLTLMDAHDLSVILYRRYQAERPLPFQMRDTLAALRLWFWEGDDLEVDPVAQAEVTGAFYAMEAEELYLRRDWDGPREILELQLAYGYARALPDQYGDLPRLLREAGSLDRRLALMAVGDGDALLSLWRYAGAEPGSRQADVLQAMVARATLPRWKLDDALLDDLSSLTLDLGSAFAVTLHEAGEPAQVRQAILRPPRSTEQVLHPERYAEGDEPLLLPPLEPDLGRGWTLTHTETVGEALMGLVLVEWSGGEDLAASVEGWGGDLLQVWQGPEGRDVVLWQMAWDSSKAAATFYSQMIDLLPRPLLPGLVRDKTAAAALPRGRWWSGHQGAVFLYRYADRVWLIWGRDAEAVETVGALVP